MPGTGTAPTILIVDDQERLRKGLGRSLSQERFRTLTASSGEEALGLLKDRRVDLVITDLVMPGMDGMALVRNLRTAAPAVKTVIITAYGSPESMREAEELGVACYLAKPFDLSDLKSRVEALLAEADQTPASPPPPRERSGPPEARECRSRGHSALCSVCHVRARLRRAAFDLPRRTLARFRPLKVMHASGKTLRAAAVLPHKALPHIRPSSVARALGRAARAISGLVSAFTK